MNIKQQQSLNMILVYLLTRKHNGYIRISEWDWGEALPDLVKHTLKITTKDREIIIRARRVDPGVLEPPTAPC